MQSHVFSLFSLSLSLRFCVQNWRFFEAGVEFGQGDVSRVVCIRGAFSFSVFFSVTLEWWNVVLQSVELVFVMLSDKPFKNLTIRRRNNFSVYM